MSISNRLSQYLSEKNIPFQTISHLHSNSSISSAISAKVPLNHVAKAVILKDHEDRKLMAILPANNKLSLSILNEELKGSYQLIKEREVYQMFADCEHGAIPPIGEVYNIPTVCDSLLDDLETVYIEAGDHRKLLQLSHDNFESLVANSKHLRFSREVFH